MYDDFKIATARQKFKLTVGKYSGTAGGPFVSQIFSKLSAERKKKKKTDKRQDFKRAAWILCLTFGERQEEP